MLEEEKLRLLINKAFKDYKFRQEIMKDVYEAGLDKHCCQILDLLILGRPIERIKRVLLWGNETFNTQILTLYDFLENFSQEKNAFHKAFK